LKLWVELNENKGASALKVNSLPYTPIEDKHNPCQKNKLKPF
jgi:hypothetical protein